ncbi:MAG: TIGR02266 family protein [Myxococcales bacterium]|nr:TIGR02266 family protein [Myxococcales bacterium]
MNVEDKRKHGADRRPVSLVVEYDGADDLLRDYTQNLSSGGAFVHTDRVLTVGDAVRLQLSFPRLLSPLCIEGIVRWVRPTAEGDSGAGIEFVNFDTEMRASLDAVLHQIHDRDPALVQSSLRVLLAEDNPHVARLIREGLGSGRYSEADFEIEEAATGTDAMALLYAESFDLLVVDINLPIMDGATLITKLRQDAKFADFPIIAVSAGGNAAAEEAHAAGADFFLEKPMRLREIIETMRKLLDMEL